MATKRTPSRTPAERLLDLLGPVSGSFDWDEIGDFGLVARRDMEDLVAPVAKAGSASRLGALEKIHVFWFAGMSCDGCSVSVTGATTPSLESLLLGTHPGLPRVVLHHPVINLEAGPHYAASAIQAVDGDLDGPRRSNAPGLPDNSIDDNAEVLEQALMWLPARPRGKPLVARGDSAMASRGFVAYARSAEVAVSVSPPIGSHPKVQAAIRHLHADPDAGLLRCARTAACATACTSPNWPMCPGCWTPGPTGGASSCAASRCTPAPSRRWRTSTGTASPPC